MRICFRYSILPITLGALSCGAVATKAFSQHGKPTPTEIIHQLELGNRRFAADYPQRPHTTPHRRQEVVQYGQHPKAIVLSCADSRVPPELLFDQGIGDLFIVRVAGNISTINEIASIEYAAGHLHVEEHLNARVVIVLGHSNCGAVSAVVNGDELPGPNLPKLAEHIRTSVVQTRANHPGLHGQPLIETAVEENVRASMAALLKNSPILQELVTKEHLAIVGAVYDLKSGHVRWLNGPEVKKKSKAHDHEATHR